MTFRKIALLFILIAGVTALLGRISATDFSVAVLLGAYACAREWLHFRHLERRSRR